jgi:hypothetical protein
MRKAPDAWGVLSLRRFPGRSVSIGQEGVLGEGRIQFWKGRVFGEVRAAGVGEVSREDLKRFARAVDAMIFEAGEKPSLLEKLPVRVSKSRTVYFHAGRAVAGLPDIFSRSGAFLGLSRDTDVLHIPLIGEMAAAFVNYPSEEEARSAFQRLGSKLEDGKVLDMAGKGTATIWPVEKEKYLAGFTRGRCLILIYGSTSVENAQKWAVFFTEKF